MNAKYKEGEYITYSSGPNFHASGIVEHIRESNGNIIYVVAEGNGGARLVEVAEKNIRTLLTE